LGIWCCWVEIQPHREEFVTLAKYKIELAIKELNSSQTQDSSMGQVLSTAFETRAGDSHSGPCIIKHIATWFEVCSHRQILMSVSESGFSSWALIGSRCWNHFDNCRLSSLVEVRPRITSFPCNIYSLQEIQLRLLARVIMCAIHPLATSTSTSLGNMNQSRHFLFSWRHLIIERNIYIYIQMHPIIHH
jgi:hypothetical protein